MKNDRSKKNFVSICFITILLGLVMACRLFPAPTQSAPEIQISTEAAGSFEQNVDDAIQQAEISGIFALSFSEEQITSYIAIKLQEQQDYPITDLQIFLRDGKVQAVAEIEQNSIRLPLEFEVLPQLETDGLPKLIVSTVNIAGIVAPDALVQWIQQLIDQAYSDMMNDAESNFTAESITIADGFMTIEGKMK